MTKSSGFAITLMNKQDTLAQLPGISLAEALLCVSCDMIYPSIGGGCNTVCPSCTSQSYLKLSTILNRTDGAEINKPSEQICVQ